MFVLGLRCEYGHRYRPSIIFIKSVIYLFIAIDYLSQRSSVLILSRSDKQWNFGSCDSCYLNADFWSGGLEEERWSYLILSRIKEVPSPTEADTSATGSSTVFTFRDSVVVATEAETKSFFLFKEIVSLKLNTNIW